MEETNKQIETFETIEEQGSLPYVHCLNCGAELQGKYCHKCGQEALDKKPSVGGFVMEYLSNAFIWDSQFFKTFWTLISRPGRLTNEFLAGRFISQEHPLKLNMFLLFVFITLFVFFASGDKINDSVLGLTNDERVFAFVQLDAVMDDEDLAKKIQESPCDTILLQAPLALTKEYSQILTNIETKEDTKGEGLDKWVAIVPQALLEYEILVADDSGYYHFNTESEIGGSDMALARSVWTEISRITSQYFPMLLLLTAPILTFSLRLVQRKSKLPRINHFIFALHYTAFLETLMICIYILHLTIALPMQVLECILLIGSCGYLAIAFRNVYTRNTWVKAIVKSLLTSLIYISILFWIFVAIFLVACFIIASEAN